MHPDRWEHGSELHFPILGAATTAEPSPWSSAGAWFGSGRDALRALLRHGRKERGWQRLLVPSYLCQEVVAAALEEIPVCAFPDRPGSAAPADYASHTRPGDVVLLVNTFGLRTARFAWSAPSVDVIEDHTHDPWSDWARSSGATYCLASLRKTWPVPDGGVAWSPAAASLPHYPPTPERVAASGDKLAASLLKALYLSGHAIEKDAFRELALRGEARIASGEISGMPLSTRTLATCLPWKAWRQTRAENHAAFAAALGDDAPVTLLAPEAGAVAFSCVLDCGSTQRREALRRALIAARVYPAVLWPLEDASIEGIAGADRELAARLLSLHCDQRYSATDMQRVAELVRRHGGTA